MRMRSASNPTSLAIFCVTYWLSPVMTTTEMPFCFSAFRTESTPSFGGSRNAANPTRVIACSAATVIHVLFFHLQHCHPKCAESVRTQFFQGVSSASARRLSSNG